MNMYRTSQNHPSVVMFSLGKQGGQGYAAYEAYLKLKAAEKDRPVIYEGAGPSGTPTSWSDGPTGAMRRTDAFR